MPRRKEPKIPDAILDQLLAGADAKTAFDPNGLLDELKEALSEPPDAVFCRNDMLARGALVLPTLPTISRSWASTTASSPATSAFRRCCCRPDGGTRYPGRLIERRTTRPSQTGS
jgi:hypothetical protein